MREPSRRELSSASLKASGRQICGQRETCLASFKRNADSLPHDLGVAVVDGSIALGDWRLISSAVNCASMEGQPHRGSRLQHHRGSHRSGRRTGFQPNLMNRVWRNVLVSDNALQGHISATARRWAPTGHC